MGPRITVCGIAQHIPQYLVCRIHSVVRVCKQIYRGIDIQYCNCIFLRYNAHNLFALENITLYSIVCGKTKTAPAVSTMPRNSGTKTVERGKMALVQANLRGLQLIRKKKFIFTKWLLSICTVLCRFWFNVFTGWARHHEGGFLVAVCAG